MKKTKKTYLTCLLLSVLANVAVAQTILDTEKLDNYFNVLEENNKFMGSVAITKKGEVIYSKTVGFADFENNIKADENSKFRIGSISKSFTAVLVLKAVEERKLNLNQTIDKWFSVIENADKITVENLLNHRSGIHNFTNDQDYLTWNTQPKTEIEMVELISKGGSDFEPDSAADYSNSNYVLLSYILEKIYLKSYSDLIQEYIINPINLTNTYVFRQIDTNKNECKSYKFAGSWVLESETDFTIPLGAGAIASTPNDLTKFADALFGGKLLKLESLEIMKTIKDGFGIGLFTMPFKSMGYGHTGGIDGFSSSFAHFENDEISFALVSNGSNYNLNDISIAVLSAVYNLPYFIPEFTTYEVSREDLDKYLGVYSSTDIPLKITVTKDDNILMAEATGQQIIPLEATEKDKFKFDQVGAVFEFYPIENRMVLKQGGGVINFTRE